MSTRDTPRGDAAVDTGRGGAPPGRGDIGAADLLSREEIRRFTTASDIYGVWAVVFNWTIIVGAFVALSVWPNPLTFIGAVIVIGGRQLALAVVMHDAAHGTLFRTRWLNEHVADWLCARPVWSDITRYRKHHLGHHAHTGTSRDPDLALAPLEPMSRASMARKIARDLSGAAGVRRLLAIAAMDADLLVYNVGGVAKWNRRGVWHHVRAFVKNTWKTALTNIALALVLGWIYLAWVVAWFTTFGLFLRIRMLAEHAYTERTSDMLRNTRTTHAGLLARATVAPMHVNYHLEHHLLPTTPWFRLPALHRLLVERGAIPARAFAPSYRAVLALATQISSTG